MEQEPDDADALIDKAAELRRTGQLAEAIAIYSQLISRYPISDLLNERAVVYSQVGDFHRAVVDLTDAIGLKSNDPDLYINRGNAYLWSNAPESALDDYEQAIALSPTDACAFNGRGQAEFELGHIESAICDFRRAAELDRRYLSPRFNLGRLFLKLGKLSDAECCLDEATDIQPDDIDVLCLRGDLMAAKEDFRSAYDIFLLAYEKKQENIAVLKRLSWLLATCPDISIRNPASAVRYATISCELSDWQNHECLENLVTAYAECGAFDKAIQWQKRVIETCPPSNRDDAIQYLTRLNERRPKLNMATPEEGVTE